MYSYKDSQSRSTLSRNIAIVSLFVGGGYFAWLFGLVPASVMQLVPVAGLSNGSAATGEAPFGTEANADPEVFETQLEPEPMATGEDMASLSLILDESGRRAASPDDVVHPIDDDHMTGESWNENQVVSRIDQAASNHHLSNFNHDPVRPVNAGNEQPVQSFNQQPAYQDSHIAARQPTYHVDPAVRSADYHERDNAPSAVSQIQTASATRYSTDRTPAERAPSNRAATNYAATNRTLTYNPKRDRVKLQNIPYQTNNNIQLLGHSSSAQNDQGSTPTSPSRHMPNHLEPAQLQGSQLTNPVMTHAATQATEAYVSPQQEIARLRELSIKYWKEPLSRPAIQKEMEALAAKIYFKKDTHYMPGYTVEPGDQLRLIAQNYGVPWQYLARLNRVKPEKIRVGDTLKVIKGPFSAVVDLSDYEIVVHAHGFFVCKFPIGTGRNGSTPTGKFKVLNKEENPVYYGDGEIIGRDDPRNPLGERWIDIGDSYGIHGTINPNSIGKSESKGCVRLKNEHVEILYDLISVGSEIVIKP